MKGSAGFISICSDFRHKDYPNYPNGVLLLEKMTMGLHTNLRGDCTSDQDVSDVRNIIDLDLPFEWTATLTLWVPHRLRRKDNQTPFHTIHLFSWNCIFRTQNHKLLRTFPKYQLSFLKRYTINSDYQHFDHQSRQRSQKEEAFKLAHRHFSYQGKLQNRP
jgi:hypothetical protein